MEIFWETISAYNTSTWWIQLLFIGLGILLTVSLYRKPTKMKMKAIKIFMVVINLWIAIVYYLIYGAERQYYYIFAFFWGIIACIWLYDLIKKDYHIERSSKFDNIAYVLFLIPFIYPIISLGRGMNFPAITTPVMPCTVTIFSIGLLMSFSKKINLFLVLFLFHWALLGVSKIYLYKIPEDMLLSICTIPVIYLYFREYVRSGIAANSKPGAQTISILLFSTCCVIGLVFSYVIFKGFNYF